MEANNEEGHLVTGFTKSVEYRFIKITESLSALSLVDWCVWMRVCKHGCDVSDLHVFLRIML